MTRIPWVVAFLFNRIPVFAVAAVIVWAAVRLMQSDDEDDRAFSEESRSDIPYPIVHPPVIPKEEPKEEIKANLDKTDEFGEEKQAGL